MSNNRLLSWGRYPLFKQIPINCNSKYELSEKLNFAKKNFGTTLPYGSGLSYGDSCLAASDHVIHTKSFDKYISFDSKNGLLRAESGVTFEEIISLILPHGWFLPVTPGTKYITLGGAIANDIHGKNHHQKGSFGLFVKEFSLLRSDLGRIKCSPSENIEYFNSTIGGLGLTGIIEWVEIKLTPILSSQVECFKKVFYNLDEFFALSEKLDKKYEFCVSWVDCSAKGANLGRGVYIAGNFSKNGVLNTSNKKKFTMPFNPPFSLINKYSTKIFNQLYWFKNSSNEKKYNMSYDSFFYPLDSVLGWNKLYGPRGFQQYQCVIPEINAKEGIHQILDLVSRSGKGSFLAVIKRFGSIPSPGLLSFPIEGITLSLDFPNTDKLSSNLFKNIDSILQSFGGRIYPAKDAHMSSKDFKSSYPLWSELEKLRDPALMSHFWSRVTK